MQYKIHATELLVWITLIIYGIFRRNCFKLLYYNNVMFLCM